MRIDSHQHFWNYNIEDYPWIVDELSTLRSDFLPEDLEGLLNEEKIDGCIAVQARQKSEENQFLANLAERHSFILGVVGWVDFIDPGVSEQLDFYTHNPIFKGFRHIVQDEVDDEFMLQKSFIEGVGKCHNYGYVYDILVFERHLAVVVDFLRILDKQIFVLDHLGKPDIRNGPTENWKSHIEEIASFENVHCKLSGMVTEAEWHHWTFEQFVPFIDHIFDTFGPQRIMFGSDWPVCMLAATSYKETISIVKKYIGRLSADEQAAIMGLNAKQVYSI